MNKVKKVLAGALLALGLTSAAFATDPTPESALTTVTSQIDSVGGIGAKAYLIAGSLALVGVVVSYIRKAKR